MTDVKIKPWYKMTEIGVIPEDWKVKEIYKICDIKTGWKNTQDKIDNWKYPFFVRSQTIEKINSYSFDWEAVLTAWDWVWTWKIFHYIKWKFDYHQRVYKMSDFKGVDWYFFYLYFSNNFYDRVMQMTAKSSVDSVRLEMISEMQIPLPKTLEEQKAIAKVLSDTDELINSFDELIEKKEKIKEWAMQELLTWKRRLPWFNEEWEEKKLWEIINFKNWLAHEKSISENWKYIVVNSKFVSTNWEVKKLSNECYCPVYKNDILMVMSDIPNWKAIAKCFIVDQDDKYTLNQRICSLKINEKYFSKFIYFLINRNKYYLWFDDGVKQTNLRKEDVLWCELKLPPTIEEQKAIAEVLSDMNNEIENLKEKRDKYKQIKEWMMQELLTGKIRLV